MMKRIANIKKQLLSLLRKSIAFWRFTTGAGL